MSNLTYSVDGLPVNIVSVVVIVVVVGITTFTCSFLGKFCALKFLSRRKRRKRHKVTENEEGGADVVNARKGRHRDWYRVRSRNQPRRKESEQLQLRTMTDTSSRHTSDVFKHDSEKHPLGKNHLPSLDKDGKDPEFERLGLNRTRNLTLDLFMNQLEDRNLSPMQDTPPGFNGTGDYNNRELDSTDWLRYFPANKKPISGCLHFRNGSAVQIPETSQAVGDGKPGVSNPGLLMGLPLPVFAKEPDRTPQPNSTFADSSNMDSFFNINNGGSFTVNRAHQAIVHHSDGTLFFSKENLQNLRQSREVAQAENKPITLDPIAENTLQQSKPEELQINIPEQVIRNFVTPSRWDQPGNTGPSPKSLLSVDVDVSRDSPNKNSVANGAINDVPTGNTNISSDSAGSIRGDTVVVVAKDESNITNEETVATDEKVTEQSMKRSNSSNHSTSVDFGNVKNEATSIHNSQTPNDHVQDNHNKDENPFATVSSRVTNDQVQENQNKDENPFAEIQEVVIHTSTLINEIASESVLVVNKSNNHLTSHFSCDDLLSFVAEHDVSCTNCLHNKSQLPQEVETGAVDVGVNKEMYNNSSDSSEQKSSNLQDSNISKDLNDTTKIGKVVKSQIFCQFGPRYQRKCKECGRSVDWSQENQASEKVVKSSSGQILETWPPIGIKSSSIFQYKKGYVPLK